LTAWKFVIFEKFVLNKNKSRVTKKENTKDGKDNNLNKRHKGHNNEAKL
jgi:hypothetical protein